MGPLKFIKEEFKFIGKLLNWNNSETLNYRVMIRFFLICALIFLLFFGITFVILLRSPRETQLPNFSGRSLVYAARELQKKKLRLYVRQAYDPDTPKFYIVSQRPNPGTIVKEDRTIVLTVSLGEKATSMPDFFNQHIEDAKSELLAYFSAYEKIPTIIEVPRYSTNIEKGFVIDQSPKTGERIHLNNDIMFLVSRGIATNVLTVSNYRWKNFKDIEQRLTDFGINVNYVPRETKSENHIGKIYEQNVSPGSTLQKGDSIKLMILVEKPKHLDNRKARQEVRIYQTKIPFRKTTDQAIFDEANRRKTTDQMQFEIQNPTNISLLKRISRKVEIKVNDELGEEIRFREYVLPGIYLDIPYRSLGKGYIDVLIDGNEYEQIYFHDEAE